MSFEYRPAVRKDVQLLILLAGGTGSGKTESAMRLATGLAAGKPFAVIDTERGRSLHKADDYSFQHTDFDGPFTPERYVEAIEEADARGFPVIVVDSGSHEWDGDGGVLEIQQAEFERLGSRDSVKMIAWNAAKSRHKKWRNALLRTKAHVIVCHRAEDKIEISKDEKGKTVIKPKESLTGYAGWIPICEKRLPFEATISLLFTADSPGVPKPIKLERRHTDLIPLDRQITEDTGKSLAVWAAGSDNSSAPGDAVPADGSSLEGTGAEQSSFAPPASAVELAGQAHPPVGVNGISDLQAAYTLQAILETGGRGVEFLKWAVEQEWPDDFAAHLEVFCGAKLGTVVAA